MESQKILIIERTGFIGTNLVHELRKRDLDVHAVDLFNTERENYITTEGRSYHQLGLIFEKRSIGCVYHFTVEYRQWNGEDYYENLWQTNAIGTPPSLNNSGMSYFFINSLRDNELNLISLHGNP
jgi:dTDP-glucose 4,6-dehydratase